MHQVHIQEDLAEGPDRKLAGQPTKMEEGMGGLMRLVGSELE